MDSRRRTVLAVDAGETWIADALELVQMVDAQAAIPARIALTLVDAWIQDDIR